MRLEEQRDNLQKIQDGISKLTDLSVCVMDPQGNLITKPSNPVKLCEFIADNYAGCIHRCHEFIVRFNENQGGRQYQCVAGLCSYIEPVYHLGQLIGFIKAGSFFKEGFPKPKSLHFLAKDSETDKEEDAEVKSLLEEIPVWKGEEFEDKLKIIRRIFLPAVQGFSEGGLSQLWEIEDLNRELFKCEDQDYTLEVVLSFAAKLPQIDLCFINLYNPEEDKLLLAKAKGPFKYLNNKPLLLGEGFSGWSAWEKSPLVLKDIKQDYRIYSCQLNPDAPFNFIACFPLIAVDRILGVMTLCSESREKLTRNEHSLLLLLSQSCSASLWHIGNLRQNDQNLRVLGALCEITRILNTKRDLKDLLNIIVDMAVTLLKISICGIYLLNEKTGRMEIKVARVSREDDLQSLKQRPWLNGHLEKVTHVEFHDLPIRAKGRHIGVLSLEKKPSTIANEKLLSTFAHLAGIAIENSQLFQEKEQGCNGIIKAFLMALETRDIYAAGHSDRTGNIVAELAKKLHLGEEEIQQIRFTGYVHDIGKVGVSEEVLNKPGKLTQEEFEVVKKHPSLGAEMVGAISELKKLAPSVLYHHENYDGSGYPEGIKGTDIPLEARILRIVDAFEAMTSPRPYHEQRTIKEAYDVLVENKGSLFDPVLVDLFGVIAEELHYKNLIVFENFEEESIQGKNLDSVYLDLTPRELEILALIARGNNNKEISRRLCISEKTVKTHITSILKKLSLPDRTKAAIFALQKGLIS